MKLDKFFKYIKNIIKNEIKKTINEELSKDKLKNILKECLYDENDSVNNKKEHNIKYSNNSLVNNILTETANTINDTDDYKLMNNRIFNSTDVKEGKSGIRNKFAQLMGDDINNEKPSIQQMLPDDRKHIKVPDFIEKALTKDYSNLIKKIKK